MKTGWVHEIFRSVQGEGPHAGVLQVFIRFCGCAAACVYCDTDAARGRRRDCVCRTDTGEVLLENPVGADAATALAVSLAAGTPGLHSLAVTGGEPLDQPDFLVELLAAAGRCGIPRYLETNGLDPAAARRAEPLVEYVALDLKLPSLCGGVDTLAAGAESCRIFRRRGLFCKVVVTDAFEADEFERAVTIVAGVDTAIPFVIQPAAMNGRCAPPPPELLLECAMQAGRRLSAVRVMPQCHPLLGLP